MPSANKLAAAIAVSLTMLIISPTARAQEQPVQAASSVPAVPSEPANDVVLQAMNDELNRSTKNLKVEKRSAPYFITYSSTEGERLRLTYELGRKAEDSQQKQRIGEVDVRVGDHTFDNTAELAGRRSRDSGRYLPLDNNYYAIRRQLWVLTDDAYKEASEQLDKQETYKHGHIIRNLCDSFTTAKPTISIGPSGSELKLEQNWDERLKKLSEVFAAYPIVRKSWVVMEAENQVYRIANTEGTRLRFRWTPLVLGIAAFARCPDGEDIWDCEYVRVVNEGDLPSQEMLEAKARGLAEKLVAYTKAERKNYYFGPVLFEQQAAGELLQHGIAPKLVALQGDNLRPSGTLLRCVNTRILPKFLNISDDPKCTGYLGHPIAGPYEFDDEGTPCTKVNVVEKGFLKELLSGRTPVLPGQASNGHCFNDQVLPTTLMMHSDRPVPIKTLEANLVRLAKEQGLKEAIIVRRIVPHTAKLMHGDPQTARNDSIDDCQPLEVYSVDVNTGKQTQVRGLRFGGFDLGAMQGIVAAGNDAKAYSTVNWTGYVRTVVAPSVLIAHLELEEDGRDTLGPYPLENPYFAAKAK